MKLIKAIRLHWRLRIRQEYACNKVCEYSQIIPHPGGHSNHLAELSSSNSAVRKVEKLIPNLYFILSDIFGGAILLKKHCKLYYVERENEEREKWIKFIDEATFCFDLVTSPGTPIVFELKCSECNSTDINTHTALRRTNGPQVAFKRMSYGYKLEIHTCKKCLHVWDGKKLQL